jgi:diguanylate cyclase
MRFPRPDLSAKSWTRVIVLTVLGTVCCIAFALAFDSWSFEDARWRWGARPENNVIIPLIIAPPFFFYLLTKLRQLAIAHEQLMVVASTDGLTSCLNRAAFTTLVDAYLERVAQREDQRQGALLVIDVDHFKGVNDKFGHHTGDEALKLIVQSIRQTLRDVDLVGRMGGEEFSVFLPGISPERAQFVAERIRKTVKAAKFCPDGTRCDLSISVGAVTFIHETTFSELYKLADRRLYEAKRNGRNRVELGHLKAGGQIAAIH